MSEPSVRSLPVEEIRDMEAMWAIYTGDTGTVPRYASPADCTDLEGLAPAYIVAAELDGLRDEAITYARRLLEAEVGVELQLLSGLPPAFELFVPEADVSQMTLRRQAQAITHLLTES